MIRAVSSLCALLIFFALTAAARAQTATAPARAATATPEAADAAPPTKVAILQLSNTLLERPAGFSLADLTSPDAKPAALSHLIVTLNKAAKDPALGGVILDLKAFDLTLAQAQELGTHLQKLRQAQKQVIVFSSDYDTATYILASHGAFVVMPPNGTLLIPGVAMELMFFKGTLDKLNMQADMVQVGKFKGAEEPFVRKEASPEFKQQIDGLADAFYDQIVSTIATNRKIDRAKAIAAVDEGWLTGKRAAELGLVDKLMSRRELDDWVDKLFANGADLVANYGDASKKSLEIDNPFALLSLFSAPTAKSRANLPAIAVIYADGEITSDGPEDSLLGDESVTPARIRKAVDKALDDDLVKAIVLRVDSPGGSATASDEIWQILKDVDKRKPVTVSMGRVAASGGYYIACAGRSITADPATITGSIGVVGGKIVIKGLFDWAGLGIQPITRGKHADMLSSLQPFTDEERQFVRGLMTETYDLFTSRVKAGRGAKIRNIDDVAQGRLFDGNAAKKVGLVDEVGSLEDTILAAARTTRIDRNYQILVYPEPKTLTDILRESLALDVKLPFDLSAALRAVPPQYRREALKFLGMLQTLRQERVMVAWPVGLIEN